MHVLEPTEIHRLLAAASGREGRTLLLTAVATGVRRGELLALRWGDVDWNQRSLRVRRSVTNRGEIKGTKSGKPRVVGMPAPLVAALREQHMASSYKEASDLIFPSQRGTPLDGNNMVRREFKAALRRARLPEIRFHDLRHTYASLLIAQGEHPKVIQDKLGHASIQITLDRYGHLMKGLGDATVEESLFGPASGLQALRRETVPQRAELSPNQSGTLAYLSVRTAGGGTAQPS